MARNSLAQVMGFVKGKSAIHIAWDLLKTFFPTDWEALARTTEALKGLRQDKSADHLLRTVMLHVGCGYSLRETVVRATTLEWCRWPE